MLPDVYLKLARLRHEDALSVLCLVLPKKTLDPVGVTNHLRATMASIILGLLDLIIADPKEKEFVSTGAGQQGALDVMEAVAVPMVG
jgi:hypothetical protein